MISFEDRLNELYGDDLKSPINAASAAGLERKGMFLWLIGFGILGVVIAEVLDTSVPRGVLFGLFGGLGLAYFISRDHRRMLRNEDQPGGGAVVLAITDTHMVILERSMWTLRTFGLIDQVPIDQLTGVEIPDRPRSKPLTFQLTGGREWRWVVPQWTNILSALPERLQ